MPCRVSQYIPESKVYGANMGPTWVLSAPDGPHVGPVNLAIRDYKIRFNVPHLLCFGTGQRPAAQIPQCTSSTCVYINFTKWSVVG